MPTTGWPRAAKLRRRKHPPDLNTVRQLGIEFADKNNRLPESLDALGLDVEATSDHAGTPFVYQVSGNAVTDEAIQRAIRQLGADEFDARQTATDFALIEDTWVSAEGDSMPIEHFVWPERY